MNDATNFSHLDDATLSSWIRETEASVLVCIEGTQERSLRQKWLDKLCAELGRRGGN
jgi:hypothetical protein